MVLGRRGFLQCSAACAGIGVLPGYGGTVSIVDGETGARVPSRVRIRDSAGKDYVPTGSTEVPIGPDRWFISDGLVPLSALNGRTSIRVERGIEFRPVLDVLQGAGEK